MLSSSCKKGDDNPDDGTVKDFDGNVYHTVTIGTQVWMVENLKNTKYRDGSPIPNVTDDTDWGNLTTGAYSNYNNNATIGNKYGKLYNWYAVNDSRNITPTGWHVPTDAEWTTLENYVSANLGTSGSMGKALTAKTDWTSSNYPGAIGNDLTKNNSSGFTALPGGTRYSSGVFNLIGGSCPWWSSSEDGTDYALGRDVDYFLSVVGKTYADKNCGLSVRCVRD